MYRNNTGNENSAYGQSYQQEFDMELDPEFDLETDNEYDPNYETEESFEMDNESENDNEYAPGFEMESEYEMNLEAEDEGGYEMEGQYESEYDNEESEFGSNFETAQQFEHGEYESYENETNGDLEAELDYVTNEQELNNWVNEIAVRDNRTRGIVRTPAGIRAVRHLSSIAVKTLPRIGVAAGGWRGRPRPIIKRPFRGSFPFRRTGQVPWWRRNTTRRPATYLRPRYNPYARPGYNAISNPAYNNYNQPPYNPAADQGFNNQPVQDYTNAPMPDNTMATAPDNTAAAVQGNPQDFMKLVIDALKNLASQGSQGGLNNNDPDAIKNAIVPAAAANYPIILQPKDQTGQAQGSGSANLTTDTPSLNSGSAPGQTDTEGEWYGENELYSEGEGEDNMNQETEIGLASELLSLNSESEVDYFLDKITGIGKKLLKKVLKHTLQFADPIAGLAGGPAGAIAFKLAKKALENGSKEVPNQFGLELEGLSGEDRDFETAKAFVRFATEAVKNLDENETADPRADTRRAVIEAAKRYAPGILIENSQLKNTSKRNGEQKQSSRGINQGYNGGSDNDNINETY